MRIRILSKSEQTNLPHVRSWFHVDKENTVASLKLSLCASVPALRDAHVRATELVLTLDDFELLDDSAVHILRDGDLIWYVERYISYCLDDICKSLGRRTHPSKRSAEMTELEDRQRKRHRPLPSTNSASGSRAAVESDGRNGFIHQATGRLGRSKSTESSSSSSSDSSSNTSSDDSCSDDSTSDSESTTGSSSDSDTNSTSSSSSNGLPCRLPRPPPAPAPPRKPSQSTYVTFPYRKFIRELGSSSQACPTGSTAWIWEAADPYPQ